MNKVNGCEGSHINRKQVEEQDYVKTSTRHQVAKIESKVKEMLISFNGGTDICQLKEFILGTIKGRYEKGFKSSFTYINLYIRALISNASKPRTFSTRKSIFSVKKL